MGQAVWHKQDIEHILRGAEVGAMVTVHAVSSNDAQLYVAGYLAALAAVATSFGIPVQHHAGSILPPPVLPGTRYNR